MIKPISDIFCDCKCLEWRYGSRPRLWLERTFPNNVAVQHVSDTNKQMRGVVAARQIFGKIWSWRNEHVFSTDATACTSRKLTKACLVKCISSPLRFSFKPTFFTGEVSLENNFCKVWYWSDQIWRTHTASFCRVRQHFVMFLPLESAVFNKLKNCWYQQMPVLLSHILKKISKICWGEATILAVLCVYFSEERH